MLDLTMKIVMAMVKKMRFFWSIKSRFQTED